MSHESDFKSGEARLVYMANQIAAFFASQPANEVIDGIADHINKFWEPRMRRQLLALIEQGDSGLKPDVIEAAKKIRKPRSA